ncbi:putative extracellular protein [Trichinella spiralis]|uniref:putative extracellular protein n=1 Tax=Trichinella spiralis TaxID=6334 RepID=UPI0001EFB2CD|nr:putative extracellular protein [Trichinella spiralis]
MLEFPVNSYHQATLLPVGNGFGPTVQVPFSTHAAVVTSSLPTAQAPPFMTASNAAESANVVHVSPQTSGTQGRSPVFSTSPLAAVTAMLSPTTVSVSGWNAAHSFDSAGCFSSFAGIPPPTLAAAAAANHGNFLHSGHVTVPQTKGLGSIIDAIRLLEGDHLFNDVEPHPTAKSDTKADNTSAASSRRQKEMSNNFPKKEPPNNDFYCFHPVDDEKLTVLEKIFNLSQFAIFECVIFSFFFYYWVEFDVYVCSQGGVFDPVSNGYSTCYTEFSCILPTRRRCLCLCH